MSTNDAVVSNPRIAAPGDQSPNTDGNDISGSTNVTFAHVLLVCSIICYSGMLITAHRSKPHCHSPHHRTPHSHSPPHHKKPSPHSTPPPPQTTDTIFDIMRFGAAGDGKQDDSKAFLSAWRAACNQASNSTKIIVPSGKTFLVSLVEFEGPCKTSFITVEILGNIVAPPRSAWTNKDTEEWLRFDKVDGLTVVGNGEGLIDGRGDTWWSEGATKSRPTALRFAHCTNLQVRGMKFKDSQMNHLSITAVNEAILSDLQMNAPPKSPNTDGIDISSSTNLRIQNSIMATGDDCIAINAGTSNVTIANITCGPGHGISIGSLGKHGRHDEVQAIQVRNCTFNGTTNGVRIKTWQGGAGFAKNISFSNINFIAAKNPVLIDQYYCPHKKCANQTSAVKISDVRYTGLRGTFIGENATINFSCSETVPCTDIILNDVDITSVDPNIDSTARCVNAHGFANSTISPSVTCLKN